MAKRQRRTQSISISPEWTGIITVLLGSFVVVAGIKPAWTGWVGTVLVRDGLMLVLGRASGLVGWVAIGMGWMIARRRCSVWVALLGGVGVLMATATLATLWWGGGQAWEWPLMAQAGGILGWGVGRVSTPLLGAAGTILWALALLMGVWVMVFPKSIRQLMDWMRQVPSPLRVKVAPPTAQVRSRPVKGGDMASPIALPPVPMVETQDDEVTSPSVLEELPIEVVPPSVDRPPRLVVPSDATDYEFPSMNLLDPGGGSTLHSKENVKIRQEQSAILEEALLSFGVKAKVVNITPGPSVTRYELSPGVGVKVAKITALSKDIALKLAAPDVRIEAPIPGKALVGIEVPNRQTESVTLRALLEKTAFYSQSSPLVAGLGLTITGEAVLLDLAKMPHVLIAGATGSGKSVCVNTLILSILLRAKPDMVKFLMIDPKKVELSLYEGIPHLVAPVVTDPNKAAATLNKWALVEMERRYETFSKVGVKHIEGYNKWVSEQDKMMSTDDTHVVHQTLPYIVVVIDELADLMMVASQEVENTICRLAQMARATGIHLVIATQRPSVDVVTGLIKANVPSRISFYLQSQIDSRTILDVPGAEKLLGKGDMLYNPVGSFKPQRLQGVFVSEREVKAVVGFLKAQAAPSYIDAILEVEPIASEARVTDSDQDELYESAKQIVMNTQYASTSYLQRKLRIGYNRAARLMDELEQQGIVAQYAADRKKPMG